LEYSGHQIQLDVVTPEELIFSGSVDYVSVPGAEGELGILPNHSPLMTTLKAGAVRVRKGNEEISIAVGGGFIEVRPDRVIVLADMAERDDLIDEQKVKEAISRAQQALPPDRLPLGDKAKAEDLLRFELARLKVVQRQKKKKLG
jgi:F-type H+-transporting ATPase subunit epsilon